MKRTNYLMEEVHVSGTQVFYLKEGKVFGNASAFKVGASKVTNRATGEVTTNKEQFRIQMKVRGTTDFSILSSVTLDQLKVATGKVWQPSDLPILAGATVLYYVSDRVEGKEFYYRPDSIKPTIAPRSGEFTSLFGIEVAPQYADDFNAMPLAIGELTNEDTFIGEEPNDNAALIAKINAGNKAALIAMSTSDERFATVVDDIAAAASAAAARAIMLPLV